MSIFQHKMKTLKLEKLVGSALVTLLAPSRCDQSDPCRSAPFLARSTAAEIPNRNRPDLGQESILIRKEVWADPSGNIAIHDDRFTSVLVVRDGFLQPVPLCLFGVMSQGRHDIGYPTLQDKKPSAILEKGSRAGIWQPIVHPFRESDVSFGQEGTRATLGRCPC